MPLNPKLGVYQRQYATPAADPSAITAALRWNGDPLTGSLIEIARRNAPDTPELESRRNFLRRGLYDKDRLAPQHRYGLQDGRLPALRSSGERTAAQLVNGELPTGYYVMTDAEIARGAGMPFSHTRRRSVYQALSGNRLQPIGAIETAPIHIEDMDQMVNALSPIAFDQRKVFAQNAVLAQVEALSSMRTKLFYDPKQFRSFLDTGKLAGSVSGIHGQYTKASDRLLQRALDPLRNENTVGVVRDYLNLFEGSAQNAAKQLKLEGPAAEAFVRRAWARIIDPMYTFMSREVNWPYSGYGSSVAARVFDPAYLDRLSVRKGVLRQGLALDLFSGIFHNLGVDANTMEPASRSDFTKLLQAAGIGNETDFITRQLSALDALESRAGGTARFGYQVDKQGRRIKGKGLTSNRLGAFNILQHRFSAAKDANGDPYFGKNSRYQVSFRFQTPDPLGKKAGYGITVSIVDTQTNQFVAEGLVPLEDLGGEFRTASGSRYAGTFMGIREEVLNAAPDAYWLNDMEVAAHGLYPMAKNQFGGRLFSAGHLGSGKGLRVFSASEYLAASVASRAKTVGEAIGRGDYEGATREFQRAIASGLEDSAEGLSSAETQNPIRIHNRLKLLDKYVANPFNLATTDRSRVNRDIINRYFMQGRLPSAASLEGGQGTYKRLKAMQSFLSRISDRGRDASELDQMLMQFGPNIAIKSNTLFATRQALRRLVPGLAAIDTKAEHHDSLVASALYEQYAPFGNGFARPVQQFNAVALPPVNDLRSAKPLLTASNDEGFNNSRWQRNVNTAFLIGGKDLETGEALDAATVGQRIGAHEQQALAAPGLAEIFGAKSLDEFKIMADMSKNTLSEGMVQWADPDLQLIAGQTLEKLVGKHGQANTLLRGQLGLLLSQAGAQSKHVMTRLQEILGDVNIVETLSGMLSVRVPASRRIRDPQEALGLMQQIQGVGQEVNAMRNGVNPIEFFKETEVTGAGGKRYSINYANTVLGTRILDDPSPSFAGSTIDRLTGKATGLNPRINIGRTGAFDLKRMEAEGLFLHTRSATMSFMGGKMQSAAYGMYQYAEAAYHTEHGDSFQGPVQDWSSLAARTGPGSETGYSAEEFEARYGRGQRAVRLPHAVDGSDLLVIPDEAPSIRDGRYQVSDAQKNADRVLRASQEVANGTGSPARLEREVRAYRRGLQRELSGKTGLIAQTMRSIEIKGKGILKAPLQQSLWAGAPGDGPFTSYASRKFARTIGATKKSGTLRSDEFGDYFYASAHRPPEVILGRMGTKVRVRDDLRGMGLYVSEAQREALMGDSDGDKIRLLLAGGQEGVDMDPQTRGALLDEFEREVAAKEAAVRQQAPKAMDVPNPVHSFDDFKAAMGDKIKSFTDVEIAQQYRAQEAQGLMGSTLGTLQEHFLDQQTHGPMAAAQASDLYDAAGLLQEEFLKVKSHNVFDPFAFNDFIQGGAGGQLVNDTAAGIAYVGTGKRSRFSSEQWNAYMGENFINPALEKADERKAGLYSLLRDWVSGQAQKNPRWFQDMKSSGRSIYRDVVQNSASDVEYREVLGQILGKGPADTRDSVGSLFALAQSTRTQAVSAPPTQQLLEEAAEVTDVLTHGPSIQSSQVIDASAKLVEASPLVQREAEQLKLSLPAVRAAIPSKGLKPWMGIGLGAAGLLGLTALASPHGRADRMPADLPSDGPPRAKPTVRVMSGDAGGSLQGYNIQARASDSRTRSVDHYGQYGAASLGGTFNVRVQDDRKKLKDRQQENTISQLKGR